MLAAKNWLKDAKHQVKSEKLSILQQASNLAMIVCLALSIWKGLILFTASESPVVVVLSGSMEPAFYRGDILTLTMTDEKFQVGDIIVFKIKGRDIPIIHRVIETHYPKEGSSEKVRLLTKGDNNRVDDRGLYNRGQFWLNPEDVIGRARGFLPYVGMVTIILNDYPWLKYILLGGMGLLVVFSKDE